MAKINDNFTKAEWKSILLLLKKNNLIGSLNRYIRFFQSITVMIFIFKTVHFLLNNPYILIQIKIGYAMLDFLTMIFCILSFEVLVWKGFISKNARLLAKKQHIIHLSNVDEINKRLITNSSDVKFKYIIDSDHFYILARP